MSLLGIIELNGIAADSVDTGLSGDHIGHRGHK